VGIATQDPELRKLFTGDPDHVVNFFTLLVMDFREIMAALGFRTVNEMVGESHVLKMRSDIDHWKINRLDFTPVLHYEKAPGHVGTYKKIDQNHHLEEALDWQLIEAIDQSKSPKDLAFPILNTHRSVGTLLSGHLIRQKKMITQPVKITFTGSAGQSFGAFLAKGLDFRLMGEANDYVGKGLSGGKIVVRPPLASPLIPSDNTIIGNTVLYGATAGKLFANGRAGERFCVRNSGASVVVEGCGSNGCEYMTGGITVILGETGANFGAGMTGGMAYVYDPKGQFKARANMESIVTLPVSVSHWEEQLKSLIEEHLMETKSPKAARILNRWDEELNNFVQICPKEMLNHIPFPLTQENDKKLA